MLRDQVSCQLFHQLIRARRVRWELSVCLSKYPDEQARCEEPIVRLLGERAAGYHCLNACRNGRVFRCSPPSAFRDYFVQDYCTEGDSH